MSTHDNPAHLMTKAMTRGNLIKFRRALNLRGSLFVDLRQYLHSNISYTKHRNSCSSDEQLSESQTHSIRAKLENDDETGIDDSPQSSTNSVEEPAKCRPSRNCGRLMIDDTNKAYRQDAIKSDIAQMESTDDDIAYLGKRQCSIRRQVGSSDCEKEAADTALLKLS